MADSFTPNLNLRKPEVGAAFDTWGGVAGLNNDMDLLDAVFLATGLGTPVGLHVGATQVLNVEGTVLFADSTDTTKAMTIDSSLITTGTLRTLSAPDETGIIATQAYAHQFMPTGTVLSGYYPFAPPGFVMADGRTIGDATSGATNLAGPTAQNLFQQLWLITTNTQCPVSGGRGASANADWLAHKTLQLPNHSGRTMAGRDDLSGTNANILSPGFGAGSVTRAAVGGQATEAAGVSVSGSLGVNVGVSVSGSLAGSAVGWDGSFVAAAASGSGAAPNSHTHPNVSVSGTLNGGGTGTASGSLGGATSAVTNVTPTIIVDVIIAL